MVHSEHILYQLKDQNFWYFDKRTIINFLLSLLNKRGMRAKLTELDSIEVKNFILTISLCRNAYFIAISIANN